MASFIYYNFLLDVGKEEFDMENDTFKVMLLANTYTPSNEHVDTTDVQSHEIVGSGYVAGGNTLQNITWTRTGNTATFDADDISWASATFTARYGVVYDTANNKLVCLIDFGGDKAVSSSTFTIRFSVNGILTATTT